MRFDYHISHVPVKYLYAADALSRAPNTHNPRDEETKLQEEVEWFVLTVISHLPASKKRLKEIRQQQEGTIFAANLPPI